MESFPIHLHLNIVAVIVCAVVQWIIGAAWYSPALFAKPWAAMLNLNMGAKPKGLWLGMVASLVGDLLLCLILSHIVHFAAAETLVAGAIVGFMIWLAFFVAPSLAQGIYEQRPFNLFAINQGYWLVCLIFAGGILAVWK